MVIVRGFWPNNLLFKYTIQLVIKLKFNDISSNLSAGLLASIFISLSFVFFQYRPCLILNSATFDDRLLLPCRRMPLHQSCPPSRPGQEEDTPTLTGSYVTVKQKPVLIFIG